MGEPTRSEIFLSDQGLWRRFLISCLMSLPLLVFTPSQEIYAASGASDNLSAYTSPIDVTGLRIELHAIAPDRNTGAPVDVQLPVGLLGPKMRLLLSTALSTELDQYWNVMPDKQTGMTPRENACKGPKGIIRQLETQVHQIGSSYGAYDIFCNLATTGKLLAKQVGSTLYLSYLLTNNTVNFNATTPYTCHAHHGTLLCPDDPHFQITFATEITTEIRTPDLCHLTAEGGTVSTQDVSIDGSSTLTGAIAQLMDDLVLGHKFSRAERSIEAAEQQTPLPLDGFFKELRTSDGCTGKDPALNRVLVPFRDFETVIQPPKAIELQMRHAGITPPTIAAPDPWSNGSAQPQPTFTYPMISANQPLVVAGSSLQVSGQYFPANNMSGVANQLPVSVSHGGYGASSIVAGGVCWGGFTELRWNMMGTPFGASRVLQVPGGEDGACANSFETNNLIPASTYEFRARDCDRITCSPWSAPLRRMTAAAGSKGSGADRGTVTLIIDRKAECKGPWCAPARNSGVAERQGNIVTPGADGNATSGECNTPLCRVGRSSSVPRITSEAPASPCNSQLCRVGFSSSVAKTTNDSPPSACNTPLCRGAHNSAAGVAANATTGGCNAPWCQHAEKSAHLSQIPIPVGSATLTPQGTFLTTVTIPSSLAPGNHTIWASNGDAEAEVAINVTAANSSAGASLMIIAIVAAGESGCPNRPSSSVMGDTSFMLFGAGFAPGNVSVYADKAMGTRPLGKATVHPDGTFCDQMRGISSRELGIHTLLAIENGAVQAQASITVVSPTHTQVN